MAGITNVYVENQLSEDVFVYASKTKEWMITDIVTDCALLVVAEAKVVQGLATLPKRIKSTKDLYRLLRGMRALRSGGSAAERLANTLKEKSIRISAGERKSVWKVSVLELMNASTLIGLFPGVRPVELIIVSDSGLKSVHLTTHQSLSWVATHAAVVPANAAAIAGRDYNILSNDWN